MRLHLRRADSLDSLASFQAGSEGVTSCVFVRPRSLRLPGDKDDVLARRLPPPWTSTLCSEDVVYGYEAVGIA